MENQVQKGFNASQSTVPTITSRSSKGGISKPRYISNGNAKVKFLDIEEVKTLVSRKETKRTARQKSSYSKSTSLKIVHTSETLTSFNKSQPLRLAKRKRPTSLSSVFSFGGSSASRGGNTDKPEMTNTQGDYEKRSRHGKTFPWEDYSTEFEYGANSDNVEV